MPIKNKTMASPASFFRFLPLVVCIAFAASNEEWYFEYNGEREDYEWALHICEGRGMSLLTQEFPERWDEYKGFIDEQEILSTAWIGLTLPSDSKNADDFRWADENPVTWSKWKPDPKNPEPNHLGSEKCAIVKPTGLWYSKPCGEHHGVVCQGRRPGSKDWNLMI